MFLLTKEKSIYLLLLMVVIGIGCQNYLDNSPPIPRGLEAKAEDSQVRLFWENDTSSILAGYNLYRSTENFTNTAGMDPVNRGTLLTDTTYTDTTAENGITYHYRLTSVDSLDNESQVSVTVKATPFPSPPDRP